MKIAIVEMELIGPPRLLGWRHPIEGSNLPSPKNSGDTMNCKHTLVGYAEEAEQFPCLKERLKS